MKTKKERLIMKTLFAISELHNHSLLCIIRCKLFQKKNITLSKKNLVLKYFFLLKFNSITEIPNNKIPIDLRFLGNNIRANNNAKEK